MCYKKAYHHGWGHPKNKFRKMAGHYARHRYGHAWFPPVNVKELEDSYELWVYAPGYEKSDFQVNLQDDTLIIEVTKKEGIVDGPWRRQEFKARPFKRQFELNEKIDREGIAAKYSDGILVITLAKLPGFETVTSEITIA